MMNDKQRMRSWMEGFQQIQDDHQRLHHLLGELEEVCCEFYRQESNESGRQEAASCAGRLNSFSHEFIDFLISHFEREERWISAFPGSANSMLGPHQRDHVRIVRYLESLMHDAINDGRAGKYSDRSTELPLMRTGGAREACFSI